VDASQTDEELNFNLTPDRQIHLLAK
jgi:hypothetical protein